MQSNELSKNLIIDALKVSQEAAIACFDWIGKGDKKAADNAAVSAMRNAFANIEISGKVVIGEGERDEAPMLYIGEEVGKGGVPVDIAVDPLEGTTICAHATPNSIAVLALSQQGGFLHAPDVYMEKIAVGTNLPENVVDLDKSPKENLENLARAKGCKISDLRVIILKRERHEKLIEEVRATGTAIQLIGDGDVTAVIATALENVEGDIYMGIGGAPEGVLGAAAMKCLGGQIQGRLLFKNDAQKERAKKMGISDFDKKYSTHEMASKDVIFAATGVTDGFLLDGVKRNNLMKHKTTSLILSSFDKKLLKISSEEY